MHGVARVGHFVFAFFEGTDGGVDGEHTIERDGFVGGEVFSGGGTAGVIRCEEVGVAFI